MAVEVSLIKYSSINMMLEKAVKINHTYRIIEAEAAAA
jgi:hypothetical protein